MLRAVSDHDHMATTPARAARRPSVRDDRFLGLIAATEIAEVVMRLSVERYRIVDALDYAERDAHHLQQERDDYLRTVQAKAEQVEILAMHTDAMRLGLERAEAEIEKLERRLAKAKRRNRAKS